MEKLKMFFKKIGTYLYGVLLAVIGVLMMIVGIKNKKITSQKKDIKKKEEENTNLKMQIVANGKASESVEKVYKQNMQIKDEEGKRIAEATGKSERYNELVERWNNEN